MKYSVLIKDNYSEFVPIAASYVLMSQGFFIYNTNRGLVDNALERIAELLRSAMESKCFYCGADPELCFVLAHISGEACLFGSICEDCCSRTASASGAITVGEFEAVVLKLERSFLA